ncbi:MAG: hypothetical protein QXU98_05145 [Candidatus Parvarchaeota archaeon]
MKYDDLSIDGYITHKNALKRGVDFTHLVELKERCPICTNNKNLANSIVDIDELVE